MPGRKVACRVRCHEVRQSRAWILLQVESGPAIMLTRSCLGEARRSVPALNATTAPGAVVADDMERTTGFEPATSTLARWCSSQLSYVRAERCMTVPVGDTGIEPVTSSVSGKRATAAPI